MNRLRLEGNSGFSGHGSQGVGKLLRGKAIVEFLAGFEFQPHTLGGDPDDLGFQLDGELKIEDGEIQGDFAPGRIEMAGGQEGSSAAKVFNDSVFVLAVERYRCFNELILSLPSSLFAC